MNALNDDECLEYRENKRYTDEELWRKMADHYRIEDNELTEEMRNEMIVKLYQITGVSIRQIGRVLKVGKSVVENVLKKDKRNVPASC